MIDLFNEISKKAKLEGASCLVYHRGQVVESLNYGFSSTEEGKKCSLDTVFRIASVSKIIVALGIMRLYQEKKLSLDEDVSKYLGFSLRNPLYQDKIINLKMILTQTSSISDGQERDVNSQINSGYNAINGTHEEVSLEEILVEGKSRWTKDTFNQYEPGTHFEYSNFGCGILACIIEKVSGEYFVDYIKKIIFDPLGLDASFRPSDIKSQDIASTYHPQDDNNGLSRTGESFIKNQYPRFKLGENFRGPAGGLFISINGLKEIMISLLNDDERIIEKSTFDQMMALTWFGPRQNYSSYGAKALQMIVLDYFSQKKVSSCRLLGHFGDAYGVKSFFLFNKKEQLGMIYITNGGHYQYQKIGIADIHEQTIKAILEKYWTKQKHYLEIDLNKKTACLDGRILKLASEELTINEKMDLFNLNTFDSYEYIIEMINHKSILEMIEFISDVCDVSWEKKNNHYKITYQLKNDD